MLVFVFVDFFVFLSDGFVAYVVIVMLVLNMSRMLTAERT